MKIYSRLRQQAGYLRTMLAKSYLPEEKQIFAMAENITQKLDRAIKSINRGEDKKEEMRLMLAPYADWDRFLSPAPLSIALLGQLILISTDTDFTLQDKKESIQFKLLSYPDSFRACLVQVTNRGWGAFNKAHTSMDQIRLHSGNVDKHIRMAVKFLTTGSPQEVELMVPDALKSIGNIADNSLELATSVEKEFVTVMEMVAELLEACTRAKGQHEQNLKDAEIAISSAKEHKKALEQEKQQAEEKQKLMMKQMKEAEEEYKNAMDSMPDTGSIVGLAFADVFIGAVRAVTNVVTLGLGGSGGNHGGGGASDESKTPNSDSQTRATEDTMAHTRRLVSQVQKSTLPLIQLACGGKNSEGFESPKWNDIGKSNGGAQHIKQELMRIMKSGLRETKNSGLRTQVEQICSEGIEICDELLLLQKQMSRDGNDVNQAMSRAQQLSSRMDSITSALHAVSSGNSLPNKPPHLSRQQFSQNDGDDGGLVNSTLKSYRIKTETAKEMLKDSRKMYDKASEEVARNARDIGEVLAELAKLDLQKIDFETIKRTLIKGIQALAKLREQWGKLVQFFQMLSNLIHCCLHTSLKSFVQTSQNQRKLTAAGCSLSDTMRDAIFEQAFQANQIAYVVNSISGVYVEISQKYLMDRITCLGKLIALDPVKDKNKIMITREELTQGCKEAQEEIKRIALEKKSQMTKALDERIGRIENEVEALMPSISEAEAREVENQAKAAVAMGKAAIMDDVDDLV